MLNHRLVAVLVLLGLLAACGQKGPLYLPEEDTSQPALED
jgi:predicted small lipoprotein YifL